MWRGLCGPVRRPQAWVVTEGTGWASRLMKQGQVASTALLGFWLYWEQAASLSSSDQGHGPHPWAGAQVFRLDVDETALSPHTGSRNPGPGSEPESPALLLSVTPACFLQAGNPLFEPVRGWLHLKCGPLTVVSLQPPRDESLNGLLQGYRIYYRELEYEGASATESKMLKTPSALRAELTGEACPPPGRGLL